MRFRLVVLALLVMVTTCLTSPAYGAGLEGKAILSPGTAGYTCFRIPALVRGNDGTLVLFAEGRKPSCGDVGTHDVVMVRSTDGGVTWSAPQVVHAGVNSTAHNPAPVVDARNGRIALLTSRDYNTVWAQYSDDNFATWTQPREITSSVKLAGWSSYATGPSHGIQLQRGAHAGRLVVGTHFSTTDGDRKGGAFVYSDDSGTTWHLGAHDNSADPDLRVQELSVFERPDGSLFAFARDEGGANPSTVASAISSDAGQTFSTGFHAGPAEQSLAVPTVQASTLELRATDRGDRYNRVLLATETRQGTTRENLTIRSTYKGGTEWVDPGGGTVIYGGMAAYTDMTRINDSTVGLAYERAASWSHGYIWFTTFTESDLGLPDGNTTGVPTTPDASGNDLDGYLRGPASVAGKFGTAISLDGTDDYVQLPFAEKLAVSSGDFTWTGWFKYGASTADQPLLWAYNQGDVYSQLWLRAEPSKNRLRALAQSGETAVTLATTKAYNDQAWHHYALSRQGSTFTLYVDGVAAATATGAIGSVSPKRPFQIHLGQRLDGLQNLKGALDDFRLYNRALTPAEISAVFTGNSTTPAGLRLRYPF
ncbi:sialidase family protein [Kribbella shirazensis]|uniref:exo-alpha-sialidase n=1 Tax=Kribbella shirazensis TaxID=1105143 RepID=A0A7X5ZXZ3_9ACTN|nr:sialidase family protein [Kribbella shirazensis]NIK54393.1 sialidase-1 [Kribbella shirazensis]